MLTSLLDSAVWVYTIMIIAWIIVAMLDLPYNRQLAQVRDFLDSVCRPYVALFRRYIPPVGPLDLSPLAAILALRVARYLFATFFGV